MVKRMTFLPHVDPAAIQQAEAILDELRRGPMGVIKLLVV